MNICPIYNKAVVEVTGADRVTFLQAQLTAEIEQLPIGRGCFACHCDAKGKTWAIYEVLREADKMLLITDAGVVQGSLLQFNKYCVFSDVVFTDVSQQFVQLGLLSSDPHHPPQGTDATATPVSSVSASSASASSTPQEALWQQLRQNVQLTLSSLTTTSLTADDNEQMADSSEQMADIEQLEQLQHLQSQWIATPQQSIWLTCYAQPTPRCRILVAADTAATVLADGDPLAVAAHTVLGQAWQVQQIQGGIASLDAANAACFIPQQMNMQALDAISFSKGCYMGQEMVARTKYLGKNKRVGAILVSQQRLALAALDEPPQDQPDSPSRAQLQLEMRLGEHWRRAGTVLSLANSAQQTWLLAVVPTDLPADQVFRLSAHPQVEFALHPLPYSV